MPNNYSKRGEKGMIIKNCDCIEGMKELSENSIDSIVTDPPYGLSFMNKKWDYDVPKIEIWKECLRVLKPGGYLLSFAGTRTQHRMAVNIEDAGFEIRDMIAWVYGSGFPKSHNIAKTIDKMEGVEHPKNTPISENGSMSGANYTRNKMDVQSELAKQWEGWGTTLKPALEPITVARKPFKGTVANNVLKYGTGGINIDECRVGLNGENVENQKKTSDRKFCHTEEIKGRNYEMNSQGRFPANLIHDGSDEVTNLFPNVTSSGDPTRFSKTDGGWGVSKFNTPPICNIPADSGSASRFFYCAKTSSSERNKGCLALDDKDGNIPSGYAGQSGQTQDKKNNHPTVKPVSLMEYLVKMVTPKGGIVLDPFAGSGSTLFACKRLGFDSIGFELDSEYVKIIQARINSFDSIDEWI